MKLFKKSHFMAAHWWIKPQIWPSQHSFALKIMGRCIVRDGILHGAQYSLFTPGLPVEPLNLPQSPSNAHRHVPAIWRPKPQFQKEQRLDQRGIIFY